MVLRGDSVLCEGTEVRAFCIKHPDDPDRIKAIPVPEDIKNDCLKTLKADAAWIEEHHDDVSMGNRAVGNLLDNVTSVYLSTIYKLENLK